MLMVFWCFLHGNSCRSRQALGCAVTHKCRGMICWDHSTPISMSKKVSEVSSMQEMCKSTNVPPKWMWNTCKFCRDSEALTHQKQKLQVFQAYFIESHWSPPTTASNWHKISTQSQANSSLPCELFGSLLQGLLSVLLGRQVYIGVIFCTWSHIK